MPQDDQPLKFTLLARMMAVYTAAKVTLAIRTFEESGSRYHQRAWTCQEFVVARRLVVATQMPEPGDTRTALSPECDERMAVLRKRIQTQSFVPLWLRANSSTSTLGKVTEMTRADGESILKEFYSLSEHLSCQFPGDRLRALLPLVSGAPLEDHQELVSLVLAISRATGDDLLDWKESLLKQHKKERKVILESSSNNYSLIPTELGGVDVDSATTDDAQAAENDSSNSFFDERWQAWNSESAFRARVMGKVSRESVLEECNELHQGMRRSKSVSGQFTTELSGLQYIKVPHKKRRRPVKRDSTVTCFSGPSRGSTRSGPSSFQVPDDASDSMPSNDSESLQHQPTEQGDRCRLPAKQKSCLSHFSEASSTPPDEEATPNATHRHPPATTSPVMPDLSSLGQDDGLADEGARRALGKKRVSLISSIVSALSAMTSAPRTPEPSPDASRHLPGHRVTYSSALPAPWFPGPDDDGQTNYEEVSMLPPKQKSLFSMVAAALSTNSVHPNECTPDESLESTDAALLIQVDATPEVHCPHLPESHTTSRAAAVETIGDQLALLASKASGDDNVILPGAADKCPETSSPPGSPMPKFSSFMDDSAQFGRLGGSTGVEHFTGPIMPNSTSQPASSSSRGSIDDDSKSCKGSPGPSVLEPSDLDVTSNDAQRSPLLPSLHHPPVPEYNPHPEREAQLVPARVSLPALHQPSGVFGPSAGGVWHAPKYPPSSLKPKQTTSEAMMMPNDSSALSPPPGAAETDDFIIDMPSSDDGRRTHHNLSNATFSTVGN